MKGDWLITGLGYFPIVMGLLVLLSALVRWLSEYRSRRF